MAIRKTKDGKWYAEVYLGVDPVTGSKIRKTKTFKRQKDAKDWERETLQNCENGTLDLKGNMKLGEYLDYWYDTYVTNNTKIQTQKRYKILIDCIKEHLGNTTLEKLKVPHIDRFYADLKKETITLKDGTIKRRYADGTILKVHRVFRQAMEKAVAWEMISKNVVGYATPPKDDEREVETWDIKTANRFLGKIKNTKLYLPAFIALHTGLRQGEISALRWQDVNFEGGYIVVTHNMIRANGGYVLDDPKTPSSKDKVAMTKELASKLKEVKKDQVLHRLANGIKEEFEFVCCWEDGSPVTPNYITKTFTKYVGRYDFKKITFHGLRHSHATILFQLGATSQEISKRLRHSRVSTTDDIYIHVTDEIKKSTAELFNKAVEEAK